MTRRVLARCAVLLALAVGMAGCSRKPAPETPPSGIRAAPTATPRNAPPVPGGVGAAVDNSNLLLGNPSRAARGDNNYLVERPQYAMSYNRAQGGPNWVAWHLEKSDLGKTSRGDFLPDPLLPAAWRIRPADYRGSDYDRGHVCPSGDRTASRGDNTATFVMSNMLPQAADLNRQVWKDLEDYTRSLVRNNEMYIIAGGAGSAGRIADGKVNVPAVCWKIIVVLPHGDNDLARINAKTRVIAVAMPNRQRQEIADSKWTDWITSVAQLQKTTGYDFLSALPDGVEKALEKKVDVGVTRRRTLVSSRPARPTAKPAPVEFDGQTTNAPAANARVWVNTGSGVYHFPGTRWYGKTKRGAYMSEAEAKQRGYRAAQ